MIDIKKLKDLYKDIWWETSSDIKNLHINKTNYYRKRENEREFEALIKILIKSLREYPKNNKEKLDWKLKVKKELECAISNQNIIKFNLVNEKIKDYIIQSTKKFIIYSKKFDKDISYEDIGQAMRNIWIVNIFQWAIGRKVEFTLGIFGYSMLYPYTDNYLDNIEISIEEKKKFNSKFLKRLSGEYIKPSSLHEEKIFRLIECIEEQFDRSKFIEVYESLYLIYNGQNKSLYQQENESIPYEKDILDISLEKGGASVLADGYLIYGGLSDDEKEFAYGYGFFLQLLDDLQDVKVDLKNKHMTIPSQLSRSYPLDKIASKAINLTMDIVNNERCFMEDRKEYIRQLIINNCLYMMFFAIIDGSKFYTKGYIREIKEVLPFRFWYCKNIKKRLIKKFKTLQQIHDDDLIEDIILLLLEN